MIKVHYAGLIKNDVVNGQNVCVSLWCQGCPQHCSGCHNTHTWDPDGGREISINNLVNIILASIAENGVDRNFSILGGEPQADYNRKNIAFIIDRVREQYPNIKIFLWTGYTIETLLDMNDAEINHTLSQIDVLIDGPFIYQQRDVTLPLRGSTNQRLLDAQQSLSKRVPVEWEKKW